MFLLLRNGTNKADDCLIHMRKPSGKTPKSSNNCGTHCICHISKHLKITVKYTFIEFHCNSLTAIAPPQALIAACVPVRRWADVGGAGIPNILRSRFTSPDLTRGSQRKQKSCKYHKEVKLHNLKERFQKRC